MQRPGPASPSDGVFVPRELAARLMESRFPYTATGDKPLIFAGRLPEEVPFQVTIPEGFVLVGGAQSASRGNRRVVEIVPDTTLSASRVRDAYRDLLSEGGWEEENLNGPGGFARGPGGFLMSLGHALGRSRRGAPVDLPGLSTFFRDARRQTLIVTPKNAGKRPRTCDYAWSPAEARSIGAIATTLRRSSSCPF